MQSGFYGFRWGYIPEKTVHTTPENKMDASL